MSAENNNSNVRLDFLRAFLSRREWVYLLSLLLPLAVYDLSLTAYDVASRPDYHGLAGTLDLESDIFFNLGYALLWIGLFAAMRRREGPVRWAVLFLFHTMSIVIVLVAMCAHWYFQETGTTLDYETLVEWIPKFDEIKPILVHDSPLFTWVLLFAALFYAALGPWLVTRTVERWRGWPRTSSAGTHEISFLGSVGLLLLALGFGSLSLLTGGGPAGVSTSLAGDPFVNVALTGIREAVAEEDDMDAGAADPLSEKPAADASLAQTPQTEKRNVVLVHLESTRAQSVTPYNEDLKTTPFLDELARSSLLAERAHVVLPRSSKGSVAVNCGIEPPLYPGPEFAPGGIPAPCLAELLKEQGYRTVLFSSTSSSGFGDLVRNFGYQEYYSSNSMDREGFEATNTFGYEDDIMLKPSGEWLTKHEDEPFMAEYFTGTGHYGYECLGTRYGQEDFSEDDQLNRYLNCLRLQDIFVKNLIDQYKELGLYDNTIFVFFGDHGEGLGEHGRLMHGDTIWEEGLRIPLIIHAPGWFEDGERVEGLSSQIDILPTVLDLLGYEVESGQYPGYSLLRPLPEDRTLMFSCISPRECMASIKGNEKYIYHYDNQAEEVFNLSKDPLEERNLAVLHSKEDIDRRREDLLTWRSRVNAQYGPILINGTPYSESSSP
jgi:lipoteichoic acid synthase